MTTKIINGIEFERIAKQNYAIRPVGKNFMDDLGDEYYVHVYYNGEEWVSSAVYDKETNPEDMPVYIEMCQKIEAELEEGAEEAPEIEFFDSMYEYVRGGDITHYEATYQDGCEDYEAHSWHPQEDSDFWIGEDQVERDGILYTRVNWGEDRISYLRDDSIGDELGIIYYNDHGAKKSTCTSEIFPTVEDAEKRAQALNNKEA